MERTTFEFLTEQMNKTGCGLYDEVCSDLHRFTKEDLKEILSEVIWVATRRLSSEDAEAFQDEVIASILENQVDDE